ncbi:MAG: RIP metalloprotease RseP [Syntrophobacteraceae bacterium]|nr:RIP metalloprotease RseP [Syntrophobacteraceae bacterium]
MLITILSFVLVLGVLIFVHELGHFLVAKRMGVTVLRFSLGFGPKIAAITRGGTEYRLSLLPLGGYVKMLGEDSGEELTPEEKATSFSEASVWKRLAIVFAGPLSNFLSAILIFALVFTFSGVRELAPVIGSVNSGSPAQKAGLKGGDKVVSIDGKVIGSWDDLSDYIEEHGARPLHFLIKRGDSNISFTVTPAVSNVKNLFGETISRPLIGIASAEELIVKHVNPLQAGYYALVNTYGYSKVFVLAVVKIVEGIIPIKTLGGPIMIAQMAGKQARKGFADLLNFMAIIGVNLAVLNLLPVPLLDGGHIFFFLIEAVTGKPLSLSKIEIAQKVGLVALLSLMVVVFYNDLARLHWSAITSWLGNLWAAR